MLTVDIRELLLPIREQDHVQGPESAKYTLVEYGDYECPDCGRLFYILRDLQLELRDDLRIVFRHYPVSGLHPHAQVAAEAAEAASAQGFFWDMHELLFRHQNALQHKDLLAYARILRLDVDRVRKELRQRVYEDVVRQDFRYGVQNGVYSTPGLFLNGQRYDFAWDRETLLQKFALD